MSEETLGEKVKRSPSNRHDLVHGLFFHDNTHEDAQTQLLDMIRDIRLIAVLILFAVLIGGLT